MWIVCITSVRHVLTVNGYGGRQTKENEKSWCFKGWETLVNYDTLEQEYRLSTAKVLVELELKPEDIAKLNLKKRIADVLK